jgi:hypothetical protein
MDKKTSSSVILSDQLNTGCDINEIMSHLREVSFKSFISWRGTKCTINNLDLFSTVVMTTLNPCYTFPEFIELLNNQNIKYKQTKRTLKILFPTARATVAKKSSSTSFILKNMEEMEFKQEKLYQSILRAKDKLERALRVNKQIKIELKKSEELQKSMIDQQIDPVEISFFEENRVNIC